MLNHTDSSTIGYSRNNFQTLIVRGDLTIDTNTLFVDSTNNRVGINTLLPTVALDVVGSLVVSGTITATSVSFSGDLDMNGNDIIDANEIRGVSGDSTLSIIARDNLGAGGLSLSNQTNLGTSDAEIQIRPDNIITFITNNTTQAELNATGINLITGNDYRINNVSVLNATTLGSGILASSLTSVGTLTSLTVSGDLTVDTNTLFVDSGASQVGINTTSLETGFALTIVGTNNGGGMIHLDSTDPECYIQFIEDNSTLGAKVGLDSAENLELRERDGNEVRFYTNDSQRMTILSGGNVGINVSDPDEQLELNGVFHLAQVSAPSPTTTDKLYNVSGVLTWDGVDISTPTSSTSIEDSDSTTSITTEATAETIIFTTTSSEAMRIESDGDILIASGNTLTMSGDLVVDTNALVVDISTEAVGINTIPVIDTQIVLHLINKTGQNSAIMKFSNDTIGNLASDGFDVGINQLGQTFLRSRENQTMLFYTNNSERMSLAGTGNLTLNSGNDLTLTSGDLTLTAGDLKLTSGEINSVQTFTILDYSNTFQLKRSGTTTLSVDLSFNIGSGNLSVLSSGLVGVGGNATHVFELTASGDAAKTTGTTWTTTSDQMFKTNIVDMDINDSLMCVENSQLREYEYNELGESFLSEPMGVKYYGFIAQEIELVCPEIVSIRTKTKDERDIDEETGMKKDVITSSRTLTYKTIDIHNVNFHYMNVVKDLLRRIKILESR